jgi:hypothetical protein
VIMVSSVVFVTQRGVNPKIEDFVDALYRGGPVIRHTVSVCISGSSAVSPD